MDEVSALRKDYIKRLLNFGLDTGLRMEQWFPFVLNSVHGCGDVKEVRFKRGSRRKQLRKLGLI